MILTPGEIAGYGTLGSIISGIVGAIASAWVQGRRAARDVAIESAKLEAGVEAQQSRDSTAKHRIAAAADRGAFERAFEIKADEHRECIAEVKGLRLEVVRNRNEIADVRVTLARCEEQHKTAAAERDLDREERAREVKKLREEIARVDRKTTPPEGTPMVSKE